MTFGAVLHEQLLRDFSFSVLERGIITPMSLSQSALCVTSALLERVRGVHVSAKERDNILSLRRKICLV